MRRGVKHLIECHCVLPQFRTSVNPEYHKFVAFSVIDEHDNVIPKCVQCNNCGVIHRVTDITKSEIALGNDNDAAVISIDDIKHSLPQNITSILESYDCDLPTWEDVAFMFETENWGQRVILTTEYTSTEQRGKYMLINGPHSVKIESYNSKTVIQV